ncbi:MAG: MarR family transcriptional regulator [Desulfobacter sp.]|nr:MAG: MarR family transcriptional regulator [Desulfobacter sp.]
MDNTFVEEAIARRINLLFRLTMSHLRTEMKKLGIGAGDYTFLIILFFRPGLSQDEMSRIVHVDKSYTARAVAKLEKMGLLERRPDPDQHRVKRVFLTQRTRDMEGQFLGVLKGWHDTLVKDIDPDHMKIIREGLDKMMDNACLSLYGRPPESFTGEIGK